MAGDEVHQWFVAGGIVESAGRILLVRNVRRNGRSDWTPPGGVIEVRDGESTIDGLTREVEEETGLVVSQWAGPAYEISTIAPELGWHMNVEVWCAATFEGIVAVGDDPDGIVVEAEFFDSGSCERHLETTHPWVREPLIDWLAERWVETRRYEYRVDGSSMDDLTVSRTS
jgi:ADP-ribose pyrophosphatase YjhB (NUDIX family)